MPVEHVVVATAFKFRRLSVVGYLSERRIRCPTGCHRECDGNFRVFFPEGFFFGASVVAESLKQGGGVLCASSQCGSL